MREAGRGQPQEPVEESAPGGRGQEVVATHDLGHAQRRVVEDDRGLVGRAVGRARDHEVAHGRRDVNRLRAEEVVIEDHRARLDAEPEGDGALRMDFAVAAGPGIAGLPVPLVGAESACAAATSERVQRHG